jgi:hypothetical protein
MLQLKSRWSDTAIIEGIFLSDCLVTFFSLLKKNWILAFVFIAYSVSVNSQIPSQNQSSNNEKTVNQILTQYDTYLSLIPDDSSNQITRRIEHFKSFWGDRASAFGGSDIGLISEYFSALSENSTNLCNNNNDNPEPWTFVGPLNLDSNAIGPVNRIWVSDDENTLLAGTRSSGLWKSIDGGTNWHSTFDDFYFPSTGVSDLYVDPNDENNIYVAASYYGGITSPYGIDLLKSIDGGATWSLQNQLQIAMVSLGYDPFTLPVISIEENPYTPGELFVGSRNLVFKSNVTQTSWTEMGPSLSTTDDVIFQDLYFSSTTNKLFATTVSENGISDKAQLFSYQNGVWQDLTPYFVNSGDSIKEIELDITDLGNIYARVLYSGSSPFETYFKFYSSFDNGVIFNNVPLNGIFSNSNNYSTIFDINGFKVTWENPSQNQIKFYLGEYTYLSYYDGVQLVDLNTNFSHTGVTDIVVLSNDNLYVSDYGGILMSNNNGQFWENLNGDFFPITEFYSVGISEKDADILVAGSSEKGTFHYNKGEWFITFSDEWGGNSILELSDPNISYFLDHSHPFKDVYDNQTNQHFTEWLGDLDGLYHNMPIEKDPLSPGIAYFGTKTGVYKKTGELPPYNCGRYTKSSTEVFYS